MSYNITKKELIDMIESGKFSNLLFKHKQVINIKRVELGYYDLVIVLYGNDFDFYVLNNHKDDEFLYAFKTIERKRYEEYYHIYPIGGDLSELSICKKKDNKSVFNYYDFRNGNYFKTEEQAKAVLKDIKSIFDKVKKGEYNYE